MGIAERPVWRRTWHIESLFDGAWIAFMESRHEKQQFLILPYSNNLCTELHTVHEFSFERAGLAPLPAIAGVR